MKQLFLKAHFYFQKGIHIVSHLTSLFCVQIKITDVFTFWQQKQCCREHLWLVFFYIFVISPKFQYLYQRSSVPRRCRVFQSVTHLKLLTRTAHGPCEYPGRTHRLVWSNNMFMEKGHSFGPKRLSDFVESIGLNK